MYPGFQKFIKDLRAHPEYDSVCDWRHREHFKLSQKDFFAMIYIHECLDRKIPVFIIRRLLPAEHPDTLKDIVRYRICPKRLYVNWSMVERALTEVSEHDPGFAHHCFLHSPRRT